MRYWAETWLPLEIAALQDAWQLWSAGGAVEGSPARLAAEQGLRDIVEDWRIKYAALFDLDISVDSVTSGVGGGGAVA